MSLRVGARREDEKIWRSELEMPQTIRQNPSKPHSRLDRQQDGRREWLRLDRQQDGRREWLSAVAVQSQDDVQS